MTAPIYTGLVSDSVAALPDEAVEPRRVFSLRTLARWLGYLDGLKAATDSVSVDLDGQANAKAREGHNHGYGAYALAPSCITQQDYEDTDVGVIQRVAPPYDGEGEAELFGRHIPRTLYRRDSAGFIATHGDAGSHVASLTSWPQGGELLPTGPLTPYVDPSRYVGFLAGPGDIEATVTVVVRTLWQEFDAIPRLDIHDDDLIGDVDAGREGAQANIWLNTAATVELAETEFTNDTDVTLVFEHVPVAPGTWNAHRLRLSPTIDDAGFFQGWQIIRWYANPVRNGT
jgi:hypothetical protein